jgi:UDP-N-acetylglucosamine--dolichyl-phosphate N-acetylglucosaminephosphotransferase
MINPNIFIIISLLASFFTTLFLLPFWIRKTFQVGLVWPDMNKPYDVKVAGSGGIITVLGFIIGVFFYVAYNIFILKNSNSYLIEIFALLTVVLLASGIGIIDDLLGWQHGGLSRRSRLILLIFSAIPLMVINAGKDTVSLPFFGVVSLGLIYPLVLIPLGIVGATATFNFLAGHNGLEASQGVLLLSALALVAYTTGHPWLSVIALCMVLSLLAFLLFNFYPAKIFPGDSLTYPIGALVAILCILGNFEKIALFFFIPNILEVFLKARGKLVKSSFGKPLKDGSLDMKYDKVYGLTHLSIYLMKKLNIKPTERKVVLSIALFQLVIIILGLIIFREGIKL